VYSGLIINPGAYSHYSIAIRDALEAVDLPCVEVHISNIYKREEFRQKSVVATACTGQISGLGSRGYVLALYGVIDYLKGV
jgi:3-dehydroquinate dehydratase-2